jgi:hypothetical protein
VQILFKGEYMFHKPSSVSHSIWSTDKVNTRQVAKSEKPTFGRVFSDVLMLACFGAMIPGYLWLGNAAGF